MSNQLAGFRATGTVTGTGNISLTSIVPNVGSIPASNLTVGQSGWFIVQAGSGATLQKEIVYLTYEQDSPGIGIMSRGAVKVSTSSNTKINFAADTTVIIEPDVPDDNIPHQKGDNTWHLIDELGTALGLDETTDGITVTAGNITTLVQATQINKRYDVTAFNVADETEFVSFSVISGPDGGGGSATAAHLFNVLEGGDLTVDFSGTTFNVRNNSGSAVTLRKTISISRSPTA